MDLLIKLLPAANVTGSFLQKAVHNSGHPYCVVKSR